MTCDDLFYYGKTYSGLTGLLRIAGIGEMLSDAELIDELTALSS